MLSDYRELLSILNAHRVKYLVIGAYAVVIDAQPRATADPENDAAVFAAWCTVEGLTSAEFAEPGPFGCYELFATGQNDPSVGFRPSNS